ncbi:MAG TPA: glycoside hydrolase family 16 protein, partial [Planctomycetota bacterium]|nr:glycoside hydrolase family 16 protein [Planctomycetota bacterium]
MTIVRVLVVLAFLACAARAYAVEWERVWSDEFDKDGPPDKTRWEFEKGFVRNQELQYYTSGRKENARVENGTLVIEARKEQYPNPGYREGSRDWRSSRRFAEYTSACLTTRGKASWTCGRIEVRAKLPRGRGVWPAIWMLGTDIDRKGWPACGEIDIMEFVGFDPSGIHGTVHTARYNHVKGTQKGARLTVEKPWEDFHVYAVEWDADRIDFFVDDRKYFTFRNEGTGADAWPFDRDQFLLLNLAIGGSWGGQKGIDADVFPQKFIIDYVRVYRKKPADKAEGPRPETQGSRRPVGA